MKNVNTYFEKFERGQILIDFDICIEEEENLNYDYYSMLYEEEYNRLKELNSYNNFNSYVIIASLGLWDGRKTGYKIVDNLTDIPFNDYTTIYKYRGEMVIKDNHQDGTNYYLIRKIKSDFDTLNVDDKFYAHIYIIINVN